MGFFRALSFLLVTTSGLTSALAADGDRVRVGGTCVPPGTSLDETLSILRAELAPIEVVPLDADPPDAQRTNVVIGIDACTSDPPAARVTVWTNGVPRTRAVSLADADADARDRTLALALAEATRDFALPIIERRAETALPEEQRPAPEPPPRAPPPADVAPHERPPQPGAETSSRPVVKAGGLVRFVASPSTVLGGGELGLAWPRATISLAVLATGESVSIGDATLLAFYATPSVDVLVLGAGASLRVTGELGLATGSGDAISPATGSAAAGLHAGIGAGVSEKLELGSGWILDANVTGGYASSLTLRASGQELIGLGGFFVAAAAGVRLPWAL